MHCLLRAAAVIAALVFATGAVAALPAAAAWPAHETGAGHGGLGHGAEGYPSPLWAQNDAAPAPEVPPPPEDAAPVSEDADPLALWDDDGNEHIIPMQLQVHSWNGLMRGHSGCRPSRVA